MANERLRGAMASRGVTIHDAADHVAVDPKTVERWLTLGRLPHRTHRWRLATFLGEDESYLWPQSIDTTRRNEVGKAELVTLYPSRAAVPKELWMQLLRSAEREVDVLVFAGLFLHEDHPSLLRVLRSKCEKGTRVRLILGDPDGGAVARRGDEEGIGGVLAARVENVLALFRPLLGCPGVDLHLHDTTLYNSIFRFDDEMLVNVHVYGSPAARLPVMHLRRLDGGDLFDTYTESFEKVWASSWPYPARRTASA